MYLLANGEVADAIALVKQFGPMLVAVVFFIWRDWKREDRLMKRIDKLEDEQREIVMPLVTKCTEVIAKNTEVMDSVKHKLRG
jgi:hypothetical protein